MWRWLLGLALVAGIAIGIVLGALNPDTVTLDLALVEWSASIGAIVALSVCAGIVIGFVFAAVLLAFRRPARRGAPARSSDAARGPTDA